MIFAAGVVREMIVERGRKAMPEEDVDRPSKRWLVQTGTHRAKPEENQPSFCPFPVKQRPDVASPMDHVDSNSEVRLQHVVDVAVLVVASDVVLVVPLADVVAFPLAAVAVAEIAERMKCGYHPPEIRAELYRAAAGKRCIGWHRCWRQLTGYNRTTDSDNPEK